MGYIPPIVFDNLERIPSSKANTTNAVYGVDGSPVVKDIYFDDLGNGTKMENSFNKWSWCW